MAGKSVSLGWEEVVNFAVSNQPSFGNLHYFLGYNSTELVEETCKSSHVGTHGILYIKFSSS